MTPEEKFFRDVATHLLKQNAKAVSSYSNICAYRDPRGRKCAAGCMIPDELYAPGMEGIGITTLLLNHPELRPYFPDRRLASDLQSMHDADEPIDWAMRLEEIGHSYGFDTSFIDEIVSARHEPEAV